MNELVRKKEVIERAEGCTFTDESMKKMWMDWLMYCLNVPAVEAIPVEVLCDAILNKCKAEVPHGKWIAQDEGLTKFMCSVCNGKNHGGHEKFCPDCGADMRKVIPYENY